MDSFLGAYERENKIVWGRVDELEAEEKRLKARIEQLEAALRSVLQYRLTDETWVKLGFDPKKIRVEFDAARKALEKKDE
jgi:hypothetical protein